MKGSAVRIRASALSFAGTSDQPVAYSDDSPNTSRRPAERKALHNEGVLHRAASARSRASGLSPDSTKLAVTGSSPVPPIYESPANPGLSPSLGASSGARTRCGGHAGGTVIPKSCRGWETRLCGPHPRRSSSEGGRRSTPEAQRGPRRQRGLGQLVEARTTMCNRH
jgi:hypothetical protein